MPRNTAQNVARRNKDDEFYTRLEDISNELSNYKRHFENKTVLCNCDDPEWSNFWIFLHKNFKEYKIKKMISTHYNADGSPSYVMEYTGGNDRDPKDWHQRSLEGNGDFASDECVELLKEADLVVTNPPWSKFSEFIVLLMKYNKKFIVIGNKQSVTEKDIFPLIKENKIWWGYTYPGNFKRPDGTITTKVNGLGRWFTNLEIPKRENKLLPELKYEYENHPDWYPKYENYDAIEVRKESKSGWNGCVNHIPYNYFGIMGVPITFLDKYNPEEFEILGASEQCAKGFSNGIWNSDHKVKHPLVDGKKTNARLFIRRRSEENENNRD